MHADAEEIWAVGSWADREPAAGIAGLIQLSKFLANWRMSQMQAINIKLLTTYVKKSTDHEPATNS